MTVAKRKIGVVIVLILMFFGAAIQVKAAEKAEAKKIGTVSNYAVQQGEWIYFLNTDNQLCKSKTNGSQFTVLYKDKVEPKLVWYENNLYCMTVENNKMYLIKISANTGEKQILEEVNDPNGLNINIYGIADNTIYYAYMGGMNDANDSGIRTWTMKTDGSQKMKTDVFIDSMYAQACVNEQGLYYIGWTGGLNYLKAGETKSVTLISDKVKSYQIIGNYIYYARMQVNNETGEYTGAEIGRAALDGKQQKVLKKFTDKNVIYLVGVKDKWIYYSKTEGNAQVEKSVYRIKTDSTGNQKLAEGINNNITLTEKQIIYVIKTNYDYTIWSQKLDGTGKKKLTQHKIESNQFNGLSVIQPVKTWLYYSVNSRLYRLKEDGTIKQFVSEIYITRNVKKLTGSVYDQFLLDHSANLPSYQELNLQTAGQYVLIDIDQDKSKELIICGDQNEAYVFQYKNKKVSYLTTLSNDISSNLQYNKKNKCIVTRIVGGNGGLSYDILGIKNGKPDSHNFYNFQNTYVYDNKNITPKEFNNLSEKYSKDSVDIVFKPLGQ